MLDHITHKHAHTHKQTNTHTHTNISETRQSGLKNENSDTINHICCSTILAYTSLHSDDGGDGDCSDVDECGRM